MTVEERTQRLAELLGDAFFGFGDVIGKRTFAAVAERLVEAGVHFDDEWERSEDHIIQFADDGWTIAHPLRERLDLDSLFDCSMRWNADDPGCRGRFKLYCDDDGQPTIGEVAG